MKSSTEKIYPGAPATPQPRYDFLKFISYLQLIGIALVVFGHSFHEYPDGRMGFSLWCYRLLYNVRMPLFSFVSGYLLYYTAFMPGRRERSVREFTVNKVKRLLVPFLFLSLLTFAPRVWMSGMADDPLQPDLGTLVSSLLFADRLVIPFFWFLQMSFCLLVLTFAALRLAGTSDSRRRAAIIALLVLFTLLPLLPVEWSEFFALSRIVRFGMYFILGVAYCRFGAAWDKALRLTSPATCLLCFAAWVPLFFLSENTLWSRLVSLLGIAGFVSLAHIMENRKWNFLDRFRGANYIIFLLSWYVNILAQQVLAHFVSWPWWIHTSLSFFGGILVPWWIFTLMQRHADTKLCRVAAFLLGQNLKSPAKASPSSTLQLQP